MFSRRSEKLIPRQLFDRMDPTDPGGVELILPFERAHIEVETPPVGLS
jgi:hypothetical protein